MAYTLPPLGYSYDALEPHFDAMTMEIHHSKHHQTYVNNLNVALKDHELATLSVDDLIQSMDKVPLDKQKAVRNQGGGHANHSFFWKNLKLGTVLSGDLEAAIVSTFGSIDELESQFEKAATTVFGSGWAWLVSQNGVLKVVTTANQDSPLMGESIAGTSGFPIVGLDVWEHAYYLKYQNRRPDYIKAFWSVVNWEEAAKRYAQRPA
jgi:Fe-Mn family superoxide dismutase